MKTVKITVHTDEETNVAFLLKNPFTNLLFTNIFEFVEDIVLVLIPYNFDKVEAVYEVENDKIRIPLVTMKGETFKSSLDNVEEANKYFKQGKGEIRIKCCDNTGQWTEHNCTIAYLSVAYA